MGEFIKLITAVVNDVHDVLIEVFETLGYSLNDKELHFWIIGIIGIVGFFFVQLLFRILSKWSITAISFIYTFTVLLVIVFAIEIQQKITGRGNMEFDDAIIGLKGFLAFFSIFLLIKFTAILIIKLYRKMFKEDEKDDEVEYKSTS
ncbi:hypothetical protein [Pseudalkalibacillus caeni]|uniref:Uncharacterized protein n=1 Tax=Exobacillus caeni TaxID=2574798 RepID=A0A5R9F4K2_9BACL|nr:hypothetical protein [Pseudalkalibacillus caeni]TLS38457.1 hypothetical protein FCL54_04780 [Pseudalkalibacillus caeni]